MEKMARKDVAKWLGVTTRTLDTWAKNGTIPAPVKIGGKVLYDREQLGEWLDAKTRGGTNAND